MDTRNGDLYTDEQLEWMKEHDLQKWARLQQYITRVKTKLTRPQLKRMKIGRNDPCTCGSGKKFKQCCMRR
ncbi:SEC-C domain-containing protein [Patescibacteria group bacterium]|nr:SEC-C domain-containing protein [Patescibacteria group bacterium]